MKDIPMNIGNISPDYTKGFIAGMAYAREQAREEMFEQELQHEKRIAKIKREIKEECELEYRWNDSRSYGRGWNG